MQRMPARVTLTDAGVDIVKVNGPNGYIVINSRDAGRFDSRVVASLVASAVSLISDPNKPESFDEEFKALADGAEKRHRIHLCFLRK